MITHVSLATVWVADQDSAKAFYLDKLGFVEHTDVTLGDGHRWCSVVHPDHPELQLTLARPGPPLDDESSQMVRRMMEKGARHAVGLATDDCRTTYEELSARGVELLQEPAERPYGVEVPLRPHVRRHLRRHADALPHPPARRAAAGPAPQRQPHGHRGLHDGRVLEPRLVLVALPRARASRRRATATAGPPPVARGSRAASSSCGASTPPVRRAATRPRFRCRPPADAR